MVKAQPSEGSELEEYATGPAPAVTDVLLPLTFSNPPITTSSAELKRHSKQQNDIVCSDPKRQAICPSPPNSDLVQSTHPQEGKEMGSPKDKEVTKYDPRIQANSRLNHCPTSSLPKHRVIGRQKVAKLGRLAYHGAWKIAKISLKSHKKALEVFLDNQEDSSSPMSGEQIFRDLAKRHPKYSQIIHTLPLLFQLLPSNLKKSWPGTQNDEMFKIGVQLMRHWLAVDR